MEIKTKIKTKWNIGSRIYYYTEHKGYSVFHDVIIQSVAFDGTDIYYSPAYPDTDIMWLKEEDCFGSLGTAQAECDKRNKGEG